MPNLSVHSQMVSTPHNNGIGSCMDFETKSDNIKALHTELLHIAGPPSVSGRILKDESDCYLVVCVCVCL